MYLTYYVHSVGRKKVTDCKIACSRQLQNNPSASLGWGKEDVPHRTRASLPG
jgi:hypothetical protein